jgi:hypothetical protein
MISSRNLDQMPDPTQLRRLLKSLSMLDAIVSPDWESRYYSYNAGWSDDSEMGSMRNGCGDQWFALLTERGVGIVGLAHESAMFRPGDPRPGMFDGLPDALAELRTEPAFDSDNCSFCLWCLAADGTWRRGPVEMADGDDPDGSADLLHLFDLDPESYVTFAADYYEVMLPIDAVEAIYAHEPLHEALVSSLNEDVSLDDLQSDLTEIGYP